MPLSKPVSQNKLLFSIIICSLPFLPFSGFFSKKPEKDESMDLPAGSKTDVQKPDLVSSEAFVPDMIAPGMDIGMWVWQRKYVEDTWERILLLDFCRAHGIKRVFIQVHFEKTPEGGCILADQEAWNELLVVANALGIKVEALDGDSNMAFAVNRADTLARLRAVLDFHVDQPAGAKFSGIHYDIEPYTTDRWKSGEHQEVSFELLETLSELRETVSEADPSLTFANDIPFWYDGDKKYFLEFDGVEKYLNEHIQDLSDFIGIMSYRTRMTGENSTSEITSGELSYGDKIGRPVYLSIETVELPDTPQITFYGQSAVDVAAAVRELSKALKYDSSFGGVFLHEYETLRMIGDQWDLSEINQVGYID